MTSRTTDIEAAIQRFVALSRGKAKAVRGSKSSRFGGKLILLLGPPGTGKTSRLLQLLRKALKNGVPANRIAVVAYTRAARKEFMARIERDFELNDRDTEWFRTVHSAAYRLLGAKQSEMVDWKAWQSFSDAHGYDLSEIYVSDGGIDMNPFEPPRQTKDDELRYANEWCRNRLLSLDAGLGKCPVSVPVSDAKLYAKRFTAFKRKHGLFDFTDLLEEILDRKLRPNVLVAFIDEGQDLSPLQIAVVEMWFGACKAVVVAGDDDQSIYGWNGADPEWLIRLNDSATKVIQLNQSFRLPARVHALAERIIRQNRRRVDKTYSPRAENGRVSVMSREQALTAVCAAEGSVFVLARNRHYLVWWEERLLELGEAFVAEGKGGTNPLGVAKLRLAVNAAADLRAGNPVTPAGLSAMLALIPSRGAAVRVPHGAKKRASRLAAKSTAALLRDQLVRDWKLGELLQRLDEVGPVRILINLDDWQRENLEKMLARHGGRLPEPRIVLTTIHGSKGREADVVTVVPDMTPATYREYVSSAAGRESENRVAFVAVTRTKHHLILVEPGEPRFYDYWQFVEKP